MNNMKKITQETKINEMIKEYPETKKVLKKWKNFIYAIMSELEIYFIK